ncbi:MAG: metalloprotease PmbA [Gammaproteobacteria bacterium]|nr:metalloprotease PmbA [Gammaproteobacteria bacterium]MDH3412214.1 metalloprotease PmbA [Gammaproteobacteria bacterium]
MTRLPETVYSSETLDRLKAIATEILSEAKRRGASAAEAGISTSSGLSVTVRMGDVETIEHTRDKGLGLTVYFGKKKGSASTTNFTKEAVNDTVRAACAIARHTSEDECAGLADAELMAKSYPDLDLLHPWPLAPEEAIEIALKAENAARAHDPRITNSEGADVSHHEGSYVYANSNGFLGGYASSRHGVSCAVIAKDDSGMQRDYWYSVARNAAALEAPAQVGEKAAKRAVERLGSRKLSTRTAPVIYTAETARGLLHHFVNAIRGSSLYREASFLLDHLGKRVFPEGFNIREEPHLKRALGSAPFDNEGVATRARDLVSDGVLQGYVLDSYSARKLGMQTTANAGGVHNLVVEPDELDFDALMNEMNTGLVITELMGMGINAVTGDYSRGACGFWVEGGKVHFPVEEITIAGNLRDMYAGIVRIANDVDVRGTIRTGSILIDHMTIAGD